MDGMEYHFAVDVGIYHIEEEKEGWRGDTSLGGESKRHHEQGKTFIFHSLLKSKFMCSCALQLFLLFMHSFCPSPVIAGLLPLSLPPSLLRLFLSWLI